MGNTCHYVEHESSNAHILKYRNAHVKGNIPFSSSQHNFKNPNSFYQNDYEPAGEMLEKNIPLVQNVHGSIVNPLTAN
jgi:hypothetical protein